MAQIVGNLLIERVSRSSKLRFDVDFVIYKMYKFAGSSAGSRKQCPVNLSRRSRAIACTGLWLPTLLYSSKFGLGNGFVDVPSCWCLSLLTSDCQSV